MNPSQFPGQTLQPIPGITGGEDQYSDIQKIVQLLYNINAGGGGGGGGAPSGPAGGDLSGTYPNPAVNQITGFTGINVTAGALSSVLISGGTVSGSATTPFLSVSGTWNTSGAANAIFASITNTASNSASNLINVGLSDATAFFKVGATGMFSYKTSDVGGGIGSWATPYGTINLTTGGDSGFHLDKNVIVLGAVMQATDGGVHSITASHDGTNGKLIVSGGTLVLAALPTSNAGLASGALYNSAGVVMQNP